jgi:hypothetical protein
VGVVFTTWMPKRKRLWRLCRLASGGSFGSPDDDPLARPKITTCSTPRERWQSVRDRRAPSLDRTDAPLHLSVPERRPRDLSGFAAWIRVSSVGSRATSWVAALALVHPRSLSRDMSFYGHDVVDRLLQLRHARGHNPDRKLGPRADRFTCSSVSQSTRS